MLYTLDSGYMSWPEQTDISETSVHPMTSFTLEWTIPSLLRLGMRFLQCYLISCVSASTHVPEN